MSKLDKLFHEKLSEYSLPPSSGAWSRIEAGISKKNSTVFPWRLAAAIALVSVVGTLLMIPDQSRKEIADRAVVPAPAVKEKPIVVTPTPTLTKETTTGRRVKVSPKKEIEATRTMEATKLNENIAEVVIEPMTEQKAAVQVVTQSRKPMVLVFTLAPIGQTSTDVATVDEKKESSFKRVVDFAITVKNSDPLGELRVMKEDLFAFDLKKKSATSASKNE